MGLNSVPFEDINIGNIYADVVREHVSGAICDCWCCQLCSFGVFLRIQVAILFHR